MRIGTLETKHNIFLAPMAGITDYPFRQICQEYGCALTTTEMVSAKALYYQDIKTSRLLAQPEESPVAVQMFGHEPKIMAQMAETAAQNADLLDINMGCPAPKITKNGEGSALMRTPQLCGEIIAAVVKAAPVPVTVKVRKGWDENTINVVEIAKIAEQAGAAAITVHGRTREQFYAGKADWECIRIVKQAVSIPVIGNGDISCAKDAINMLEQTDCDGVMIGRGAIGNPWIFEQTAALLNGEELLPPEPGARIAQAIDHATRLIAFKGEYIGIREARKHIAYYIKGLKEAANTKNQVCKAASLKEVEQILSALLEKNR